jgi:adenosyl cobinamide kinase/adenosyl cobinamide phosphate guanylyltransferase
MEAEILTRSFRDTVVARAKRDPEFKTALLAEALQSSLEGEIAPGMILLLDCINATVPKTLRSTHGS